MAERVSTKSTYTYADAYKKELKKQQKKNLSASKAEDAALAATADSFASTPSLFYDGTNLAALNGAEISAPIYQAPVVRNQQVSPLVGGPDWLEQSRESELNALTGQDYNAAAQAFLANEPEQGTPEWVVWNEQRKALQAQHSNPMTDLGRAFTTATANGAIDVLSSMGKAVNASVMKPFLDVKNAQQSLLAQGKDAGNTEAINATLGNLNRNEQALSDAQQSRQEKYAEASKNLDPTTAEWVNAIGSGMGSMVPQMALGAVNPSLSTLGLYAQGAGSYYDSAVQQGASYDQAYNNAIGGGIATAAIEKIAGGVPFEQAGLIASNKIAKQFAKSKAGQYLIKRAADAIGEGFEEVVENVVQPIVEHYLIGRDINLDTFIGEEALKEDMMAAVSASIGSIAFGTATDGVNAAINKTLGAKTNAQTDAEEATETAQESAPVAPTQQETQAVETSKETQENAVPERALKDNPYDAMSPEWLAHNVAEKLANGEKLSNAEMNTLYANKQKVADELGVDVATFGTTKAEMREAIKDFKYQASETLQEAEETPTRQAELAPEEENVSAEADNVNSDIDAQEVSDSDQAKIDEYMSKRKQVSESDINLVRNVAAKFGRRVRFEEMPASVMPNGNIFMQNAHYDKSTGEIVMNTTVPMNRSSLSYLVHEMMHSTESGSTYQMLSKHLQESKTITDIIGKRYGLDGMESLANYIKDAYGERGVQLDDADAMHEAVAFFAEQNLFKDQSSIDELVRGNRTLGQRILDTIRDAINAITGNNSEKTELRRIERMYEKALQETEKNTATENSEAGSEQYAIEMDDNGNPYVRIEDDILAGVPKDRINSVVADTLLSKYPNGIDYKGWNVQVTGVTVKEFLRSKYTTYLYNNDADTYLDKMRTAGNLDEIVQVADGIKKEDLKHKRKDNIVNFNRAYINMRIGNHDYSAEVVTAIYPNSDEIVYDIVQMNPTKIETSDHGLEGNPSYREVSNVSTQNVPHSSSNSNSNHQNSLDIGEMTSIQEQEKQIDKQIDDLKTQLKVVEDQEDAIRKKWEDDPNRQEVVRQIKDIASTVGRFSEEGKKRYEALQASEMYKLSKKATAEKDAGLEPLSKQVAEIRSKINNLTSQKYDLQEKARQEKLKTFSATTEAADRHRKDAAKEFGYTTRFESAGYLLPNGKMLDFSGSEDKSSRYMDHRDIAPIFADGELEDVPGGNTAGLNAFLAEGNVRIMAESPGVDISSEVEPTAEQYKMIRRMIDSLGVREGQFGLDISKPDGNVAAKRWYDGRVRGSEIVKDIQAFYKDGKLPQRSELNQFRYSLDLDSISDTFSNLDNSEPNATVQNDNGELVAFHDDNGQYQYNLSTWDGEDGQINGRSILKKSLDKMVSKDEITREDADAIMSEMEEKFGIAKRLADSGEYESYGSWARATVKMDSEGKVALSCVVPNGDYTMNIDFSRVCKKRATLNRVLNEMVADGTFNARGMTEADYAKINEVIRTHGFEVACGLCFVDAKRYAISKWATSFADPYNALVDLAKKDATTMQMQDPYEMTEGAVSAERPIKYDALEKALSSGKEWTTDDGSQIKPIYRKMANLLEGRRVMEFTCTKNKPGTLPAKAKRQVAALGKENCKVVFNDSQKAGKIIWYDEALAEKAQHLINPNDMISSRGMDAMRINYPEVYAVANGHMGTAKPKTAHTETPYQSEIVSAKGFTKEKAFAVGGLRMQSFSDYRANMFFDYMQAFADLSAKKMPVQSYTKEPAFAKIFGMTGAKINMSLLCQVNDSDLKALKSGTLSAEEKQNLLNRVGLNEDGTYCWGTETFDPDEAFKLQSNASYGKNCGTIVVALSYEHAKTLLADPKIRMVIPYHKSGLNHLVAQMTNVEWFTDYTNFQNETHAKTGSKVDGGTGFDFYGQLKKNEKLAVTQAELDMVPKRTAEDLVRYCEKKGYRPRFPQFAYHITDGSTTVKYDSNGKPTNVEMKDGKTVVDENYYKVLEDFALYDEKGHYSPQQSVKMNFPNRITAGVEVEQTNHSGSMNFDDYIGATLQDQQMTSDRLDSQMTGLLKDIHKEIDKKDLMLPTEKNRFGRTSTWKGNDYVQMSLDIGDQVKLNKDAQSTDTRKRIADQLAEVERAAKQSPKQRENKRVNAAYRMGVAETQAKADDRLAKAKADIEKRLDKSKAETTQAKAKTKQVYETKRKQALRESIKSNTNWLTKRVNRPTEGAHIPVDMVEAARDVAYLMNMETAGTKALIGEGKAGEKLNKLLDSLRHIETKESNIQRDFLNSGLTDMVQSLKDQLNETQHTVSDMTESELAQVDAILKGIKKLITTAGTAEVKGKKYTIAKLAEEAAYEVRKSDGISTNAIKRQTQKWSFDIMTAKTFFNAISNWSNGVVNDLREAVNDGQRQMYQYQMEIAQMFAPVTDKAKMKAFSGRHADMVDVGLKDGSGNAVKITHAQLCSLYMHLQNSDNADHILSGGLSIPDPKLYAAGKISEATTQPIRVRVADAVKLLSDINNAMTDYDREWCNISKGFFNDYCKKLINKTSLELVGFEKARVENYFPIQSDKNFAQRTFDSIMRDGSIEGVGFLKERKKGKNPILLVDINQVVDRQAEGVSKYAGLAIPVRNFQNVWNATSFGYEDSLHNAVANKWSKPAIDYVDKWIADVQFGQSPDSSEFAKSLSGLRGNYAQSVLTLNPTSALSQVSLYSAAPVLGMNATTKALTDLLNVALPGGRKRSLDKINAEIAEHSPMMWIRKKGSTGELYDFAHSTSRVSEFLNSEGVNKLTSWISRMDENTIAAIWMGAKHSATEQGLAAGTDEYWKTVTDLFNRAVEETQPNYTPMQMSQISRSKDGISKMLSMFKSPFMSTSNTAMDAFGNYKAVMNRATASPEDKKKARELLAKVVASQLIQALMSAALRTAAAAFVFHKFDDLRDETGEFTGLSILENIGWKFMSNMVSQNFPILAGDIFSAVQAGINGSYYSGDVGTNALDSLSDALADLQKLLDGGATEKEITNAVVDAFTIIGLPAIEAKNWVKSFQSYAKDIKAGELGGSYQPTGANITSAVGKAITEDKYSTAKAQKRIDAWYRGWVEKNGDKYPTEEERTKNAESSLQSTLTLKYKPQYIAASQAERNEMAKVLTAINVNGKTVYSQSDLDKWVKQ